MKTEAERASGQILQFREQQIEDGIHHEHIELCESPIHKLYSDNVIDNIRLENRCMDMLEKSKSELEAHLDKNRNYLPSLIKRNRCDTKQLETFEQGDILKEVNNTECSRHVTQSDEALRDVDTLWKDSKYIPAHMKKVESTGSINDSNLDFAFVQEKIMYPASDTDILDCIVKEDLLFGPEMCKSQLDSTESYQNQKIHAFTSTDLKTSKNSAIKNLQKDVARRTFRPDNKPTKNGDTKNISVESKSEVLHARPRSHFFHW